MKEWTQRKEGGWGEAGGEREVKTEGCTLAKTPRGKVIRRKNDPAVPPGLGTPRPPLFTTALSSEVKLHMGEKRKCKKILSRSLVS